MWDGAEVVEERDGTSTGVVTKRYFGSGVEDGGEKYFYTRDHLGSIREVIDGNGNLAARYDYDPWGRPTQVAGSYKADWGYAGYWAHRPSGLNLTWYRAYDAEVGRWLSRDPIGETGGLNLYGYVGNDVINYFDSNGLAPRPRFPKVTWKRADGSEASGPGKGNRISGPIPQCHESFTCRENQLIATWLAISISSRRAMHRDLDGHGRRIENEQTALYNCIDILLEKYQKGECLEPLPCHPREKFIREQAEADPRPRGFFPRIPSPRLQPSSGRPFSCY